MKSMKGDVCLTVFVMIVAGVYLYMDMQLPATSLSDPIGPRAFPAVVGLGLIGSALLLLVEAWAARSAAHDETQVAPAASVHDDATDHEASKQVKTHPLILAGMVVWTALYYACFEPVGYLSSTGIFLIGLLTFFNRNKHKTNIAIALGVTVFFYLLFSQLLGVPMPTSFHSF